MLTLTAHTECRCLVCLLRFGLVHPSSDPHLGLPHDHSEQGDYISGPSGSSVASTWPCSSLALLCPYWRSPLGKAVGLLFEHQSALPGGLLLPLLL